MRVLIVDDHPLFCQGLRALLSAIDPALDATDVGSVMEAKALQVAGYQPELVLLDMNLPGASRLDALREVKTSFEAASVVVVSADEEPALIRSAIDAGAAGYIPKTTDAKVTVQALRLVLANGVYLPALAIDNSTPRDEARSSRDMPDLSPRQMAVLRCLLQGKPNKIIARELNMAEGTVKAHLWAVYQTLSVHSRTQAMYRVHELGLLAGLTVLE